MYNIFQSYSPYFLLCPSTPSGIPPTSPSQFRGPTSSPLFSFIIHQIRLVLLAYTGMRGHPLECGQPTRGHTPKENRFFLHNCHGLPIAPQLGVGACVSLPHPCWSVGVFGDLALCRQFQCLWIPECSVPVLSKSPCILPFFLTSGSYEFSALFSGMFLEPWGVRCNTDVPFRANLSTDTVYVLTSCEFLYFQQNILLVFSAYHTCCQVSRLSFTFKQWSI